MTTNHPGLDLLRAYRTGTLPPAELLAVDDHLARCADCRRIVSADADARTALRKFAEAVAGEHLEYEAMERHVERRGTPDEQAAVAEHVAICDDCSQELADLARVRVLPRRKWRAIAIAAAAAAAAIVIAFLLVPGRRNPTATPAATARPPVAPPRAPAVPPARNPLQALDPSLRAVAAALQAGTLVSADLLASLAAGPEQQRAADDPRSAAPRLLEPVGTVLETDRPTFRWTPAPAGQRVTVQVFDGDYALVAESPRLRRTTWKVPSKLTRGATYRWQLEVRRADEARVTVPAPPASPALFHVISERAAEELAAARQSGSTLEAGLICMREGLLAEGARMLARYAEENPELPVAAGLAEAARAAMAQARRR